MNIVSRSEWGARRPAGTGALRLPVTEVWLHHSVTAQPKSRTAEYQAMRVLEDIGQSRFGAGVSYTFAVMPSGQVYKGTGAGRVGTHTGGRNSTSHGIVLVGNYEEQEPTGSMLQAVADLLLYGKAQGWWKYPQLAGGHRDLKQTACPGIKAYRQIGRINELAGGPAQPEEDIVASKEELSQVVNEALSTIREELAAIRKQNLEVKARGDRALEILRREFPEAQ